MFGFLKKKYDYLDIDEFSLEKIMEILKENRLRTRIQEIVSNPSGGIKLKHKIDSKSKSHEVYAIIGNKLTPIDYDIKKGLIWPKAYATTYKIIYFSNEPTDKINLLKKDDKVYVIKTLRKGYNIICRHYSPLLCKCFNVKTGKPTTEFSESDKILNVQLMVNENHENFISKENKWLKKIF